jgi:hypothetical protein
LINRRHEIARSQRDYRASLLLGQAIPTTTATAVTCVGELVSDHQREPLVPEPEWTTRGTGNRGRVAAHTPLHATASRHEHGTTEDVACAELGQRHAGGGGEIIGASPRPDPAGTDERQRLRQIGAGAVSSSPAR